MSAFGGDSWAREAHHRKRRVEDLISSTLAADSSYRRLSNGKLACLVCPNFPVLDSPVALSLHCSAPRHAAALARLRDRQLRARAETDKRIALSPPADCAHKTALAPSSAGKSAEDTSGGPGACRGAELDDEERRRRREMEPRFTAAGWKRDCHGKWFRDENAEFDSDEEDPNSHFL